MKRERKSRRAGFWGGVLEFLVDAGELVIHILIWPFKILGRFLLAILEGLAD